MLFISKHFMQGVIQYYTCGSVNSVTTLLDVHHGKFVGIGALPLGGDCAVVINILIFLLNITL